MNGRARGSRSGWLAKVAVIVVESRISDCYLLPAPIEAGDKCRIDGVDAHVIPSLIIVHYQYRHRCNVCNRGVSSDIIDMFYGNRAPQSALLGRPRFGKPLRSIKQRVLETQTWLILSNKIGVLPSDYFDQYLSLPGHHSKVRMN